MTAPLSSRPEREADIEDTKPLPLTHDVYCRGLVSKYFGGDWRKWDEFFAEYHAIRGTEPLVEQLAALRAECASLKEQVRTSEPGGSQ